MGGGAPDPVYGIGQGLQSGAARGFVEGKVELAVGGQVLGGFNDGPVELGDGSSGCPGRVQADAEPALTADGGLVQLLQKGGGPGRLLEG